MLSQSPFLATFASASAGSSRCSWPIQIISKHRDLDLTQCFEHAVLLPLPLAVFALAAFARILRTRGKLSREQIQWRERNRGSERLCRTKMVRRILTPT